MKKISVWTLVLLLPVLAALAGLTAMPAVCLAAEKLTVAMSLDKEGVIQAGDSLTVTLTPSGGTPPYTCKHTMYIYEQGEPHYSSSGEVPDSSHTWTIGFGDSVKLKGMVRDADGKESSCEASVTVQGGVYNPLTFTGDSLSPGNVIHVGDTLTYSVFAQGGQPPYSYRYRLTLYQDDCWSIPENFNHIFSSNSFSYTITRGTKGDICFWVHDALGRTLNLDRHVGFTILGDEHEPMGLSTTQSIKMLKMKIGDNKYGMIIQASVKAGTQPVMFYCLWNRYKKGDAVIGQVLQRKEDGKFILEGDFHKVKAFVWAIDADGWTSDVCTLTFDPNVNPKQFMFEWIKSNLLGKSRREEWSDPDWKSLIAQLDEFPGTDSSPDPFLDAVIPKLVQLELIKPAPIKPGLIEPEATTTPKIAQPEILQPGITAPQLPVLQQPIRPKP
ncbi:MAG: hypothetical protein ACOX62_04970 [Christensenellales bacterium]